MFQHLVDENNLESSLRSKGIGELQMRFIKSIIDQSLEIPEEMVCTFIYIFIGGKVLYVFFCIYIETQSISQKCKFIFYTKLIFVDMSVDKCPLNPYRARSWFIIIQIVRDPCTNIDAVTQDSIARDSYLLNLPCNFDHK